MNALHAPFWRVAISVALLASAALYPLQYTLRPQLGDLGVAVSSLTGDALTILGVTPGGSAERAGIRKGDKLIVAPADAMSTPYINAGETRTVTVERGGRRFPVTLKGEPQDPGFDSAALLRTTVNIAFWVFAVLVLSRGWNTPYGPIIALYCSQSTLNAATDGMIDIIWVKAGPLVASAGAFTTTFASGIMDLSVIFLCGYFARRSKALRALACLTVADTVLSLGFSVVRGALIIDPTPSFAQAAYLFTYEQFPFYVVPLALLITLFTSKGEGRARFVWLFLALFPSTIAIWLTNAGAIAQLTYFLYLTGAYAPIQTIGRCIQLLSPIFLFYGLLVRRAIDIGFVVNRALVYTIVSVILIGAFVSIEFLAARFFIETRELSILFQLVLALAIGFSTRYLHRAVDTFVDRVFFAKRHADDKALERFSQEAGAFDSRENMLDYAIETLRSHTDAEGVAIYLSGAGPPRRARTTSDVFPETIDLDDLTLVALRASHQPVEIETGQLPAGMAFPAMYRGELVGSIALLPKRDHTAYAPDERDGIQKAALALGQALGEPRADQLGDAIADRILARLSALKADLG